MQAGCRSLAGILMIYPNSLVLVYWLLIMNDLGRLLGKED
jgi:hypothetical protein